MQRILTCLAWLLSLGLVVPAIVADGHQAARVGAVLPAAAPEMVVDALRARSANGKILGTIIASALIEPAEGKRRPVVVVFNGGPGAATGWLQLGLLGPWRAVVSNDPKQGLGGPIPLVANHDGLWDRA